MNHLSYIKSRCLTNTPKRFGARWRHLQGMPSQMLTSHHVKWFQTTARLCCNTQYTRFIKFHYGHLDDQAKLGEV